MPVLYEKPALNLRSELASLKNQGGYSEQQFWFENLVTNGTMAADTDWTKGTGWTIAAGVATKASGTASSLLQENVVVSNKIYKVQFTISSYSAGNMYVILDGSGSGTSRSADGTYTENITAVGGNSRFSLYASSSFVGSIDNVSVYETDGTDVIHTMPKGWVPKDVFEDGLLQREGSAHDYEVVYDGFDYYVKPAVAPSATTQTCVIGVRK